MGRRGTKPKPIQQQITEGDPRKHGKNKLKERLAAEPKAARGLPPCPKHLTGRARDLWKFLSEELEGMKLDRRPDGAALEGMCRAYDRAVTADLVVDAEGMFFEKKFLHDSGEIIVLDKKKHPAVEISTKAWLLVKAFCVEFGLTPVSRMRLTVEKTETSVDDDLMKALSAPRIPRPDMDPFVH